MARKTYSVPEVAEILGVSRQHAYRQVEAGEIPHIKIGNRILIPRAGFEQKFHLDDAIPEPAAA